jgi:hypothetical protein
MALLAGGATFVVLTLVISHHDGRTKTLKAADTLLENSYNATQVLVSDLTVPDSIIEFIGIFWKVAGTPDLARHLAVHAIQRAFATKPPQPTELGAALSRDLERLTKAQKETFAAMVAAGIMSGAAADPLFSRVFLNVAKVMLSRSGAKDDQPSVERATTFAYEIARSDHHLAAA